MGIDEFFQALWRDYTAITPQAERIHQLLQLRGQNIINDHVAFRTFKRSPFSISSLEPLLLELGYQRFEPYYFANKHLDAWAYLPPENNYPRIFFSELRVEELSKKTQSIINRLLQKASVPESMSPTMFFSGRLWPLPSWEEYQQLLEDSEYAAWLSVMGLRANHFTVSINHLDPPDIHTVVQLLQGEGFPLNNCGGIIKGKPEDLLEQMATLADEIVCEFANGDQHNIKTCYYEFAKRYPNENGELYQGFVAANADNIFTSTDSKM